MTAADSAALKLWSFWYNVSVTAIILGVALEVPEIVRRWSKVLTSRFRKRRAIEPWYSAPGDTKARSWIHAAEALGWFVLLAGLGLEQWAHIQIGDINDREIIRLTQQLDWTSAQARDALNQAAAAINRAATNLWQIEEARKDLLPRVFKYQRGAIVVLLHHGSLPVGSKSVVVSPYGDSECRDVIGQIKYVIANAGWPVLGAGNVPIRPSGWREASGERIDEPDPPDFVGKYRHWLYDLAPVVNGIIVFMPNNPSQDMSRAVHVLVDQLNWSGMLAAMESGDSGPFRSESNLVVVLVGRKPTGDARRQLENAVRESDKQASHK